MRFQKNNKYGFVSNRERPLDSKPISFKGFEGQRDALKNIPGWQEQLREFVDQLIEKSGQTGSNG